MTCSLIVHYLLISCCSAWLKLNPKTGLNHPGVHKTGLRGIQDTRQIVDGKTNDIENNDKKGGSKPLT